MRLPFSLLRPVKSAPPEIPAAWVGAKLDLVWLLGELDQAQAVAIDLETCGTETWKPETKIVGIGVGWIKQNGDFHANYYSGNFDELIPGLADWSDRPSIPPLVNHNVYFDQALARMHMRRAGLDKHLKYTHCTYGLYKSLAGEGFPGQKWGLKPATIDLLGWPERHDAPVDDWLTENGHFKWTKSKGRPREMRADKSEMWRVPIEILGKYCLLDCFAALELYSKVLRPQLDKFPALEEFHQRYWLPESVMLADQQLRGIRVDRAALEKHKFALKARLARLEAEIRTSPVLGPEVAKIEEAAKQKSVYKLAVKEPSRLTKTGKESKKWDNWRLKMLGLTQGVVQNKRWSPSSAQDIRKLLFDSGLVRVRKLNRFSYELVGINGPVEIDLTDSGLYAVGADCMSQLPDWGKPLAAYRKAHKELSYVESYLELIFEHAPGEWRLHAGWIMAGTKTLRLASTSPNLAQMPKSLELLKCFIPDEGCGWFEGDWSTIEPRVLCEMSEDEGLMQLYGPAAKPHDRYLFSVAHYPGSLGDAVRAVYDVNNPTPESVAVAKKKCARERDIGKTQVLSGDYGAGWRKQQRSLRLKGTSLTDREAADLNAAHKMLHAGVYGRFIPDLEREWHKNGGWVMSGLEHPVCVWGKALKDVCNRVVQRTAHEIHVMFVTELDRRLRSHGVDVSWVICDYHDQMIGQAPSAQVESACKIAEETRAWLNQELGGVIPLIMEVGPVDNLAHAKMSEKYLADKAKPAIAKDLQ